MVAVVEEAYSEDTHCSEEEAYAAILVYLVYSYSFRGDQDRLDSFVEVMLCSVVIHSALVDTVEQALVNLVVDLMTLFARFLLIGFHLLEAYLLVVAVA